MMQIANTQIVGYPEIYDWQGYDQDDITCHL